jgi:hypothetical protein
MNQPNQNQMQVKADDKALQGVYSNSAQVQFQKEEFVLDFLNQFPPMATLNARVILSPGHMKRLTAVLTETVKRYEAQYGVIAAAEAVAEIGFATK